MRIGFYNPYLGVGSLGGGERYLFGMLEEAARLDDAELAVYSPRRPTRDTFERLGLAVSEDAFAWAPAAEREVSERSRGLDLLVPLATDVPVLNRARRGLAVIQFPFRARERRHERALAAVLAATGRRRAPAHLRSYDRFLCYSRFAQRWIARRLGVEAAVLAPPVDLPDGPPRAKGPAIVSVARFFRGGHEKRQDVLIDAFRRLCREGGAEGWRLHLVGAVDPGRPASRWLERLRRSAAGLPVSFHLDAPRRELLDVLAGSALFWHAAGFGVNPARNPERLEHFGIATVEAMAHGAVPLVVASGGQAEIVEDGRTGRHWATVEELVQRTHELIDAPGRAEALRSAAVAAAQAYGTPRFRAAVRGHLLELVG
jgi:O-antigen biosynthesis protein